jgi:Flp pilus assembly protein TadB
MTAAVLGAGVGVGLLLAYVGWRPRAEPLAAALARLDPRPPTTPAPGDGTETWDVRLGTAGLRHVGILRDTAARARQDLRTVGRSAEEQAARTMLYGGFGLFLGPWLGLVTWLAGAAFPPAVLGAAGLLGAGVGVVAPWASVHTDARRRRRDFLLALATWCDLVSRCLASGRGVDQSVTTAARAGSGWAFGELRAALSGGAMRGETPWASLDLLGTELGIEDLRELSATIGLAGEEGAAVRDAVSTKARTIRDRITSDTERIAEAATAQMPMPTFMVAMGFLVFLGWPALVALSRSGF